MSILVVDDEEAITEVVAEYLRTRGLQVAVAGDGHQAFQRIQSGDIKVVLTDLRMPLRGGMSLLEAMVEQRLPVVAVVMTGFGTVETATQAFKLGAVDYLLKPVRLREVFQAVEEAAKVYDQNHSTELLRRSVLVYEQLLGVRGPIRPVTLLADLAALARFMTRGAPCRLELIEGGTPRVITAAGPECTTLLSVGEGTPVRLVLGLPPDRLDPGGQERLLLLVHQVHRRLVEQGGGDLPVLA